MNATTASAAFTAAAPALVLNARDVTRLERLLETPALAALPVAEELQVEMARADIVEPEAVPPHVVTMNSTVLCREEGSGREHRLTLVYPADADAASGKVSVFAPVGAALLGLSIGQCIDWPVPGGMLNLRVLDIPYQPEAAGDWHR
jgi:regulator of nucleoside diphosphate kinase